ncbi:hypothetical protein BU24DRAFT_416724 [Aaosphaeria arxii CBS 175.79]|uniref:Ras guanyl-nucleotide exchange factor RasGEF n=1 Tax=Aaosphaeria arxii CBS 175.79 TaxID=1450172 RepID=A0A6A5Y8H6_9PLEO|nr:uncharacterized protein BU24DRAFT_416724 [Aaosphaeria arxii CBS 175.79]KAF2021051.1 hypothetical protein BU24DRAFT_416724 [Aaosphaeria arxii CBS 175.79]
MSAPPARTQILSLYRHLLRELPVRSAATPSRTAHQKLSSPSQLQKRLRSILSSQHANEKGQLQQAEQFVRYVQAQRMYATLIERYNPGMGMSEEERVRLTARRVGMDLPVEHKR